MFDLYYGLGNFLFQLVYLDFKNPTVNTTLSSLKLKCFVDSDL